MKFCPKCEVKLKKSDSGLQCSKCGYIEGEKIIQTKKVVQEEEPDEQVQEVVQEEVTNVEEKEILSTECFEKNEHRFG